jgi:DNA-binding transcriptional regulator GbsR (MarR family)
LETVETHLQEKIKKNIDPIKNKIITLKKELEDQQEELQEKIQEISKNISELEDNLNSIEKTETVIKVDDEKPEITPEEVIKLINQAKGTIDGDRVGG